MDKKSTPVDDWQPCPPGELKRMADRIRLRERRKALKKMGAAGAALLVAVGGGYLAKEWFDQPREYHFGGIACSEVMPLLPDYRAGKLDELLRNQVSEHLDKCPNCGPMYRRMLDEMQRPPRHVKNDDRSAHAHAHHV